MPAVPSATARRHAALVELINAADRDYYVADAPRIRFACTDPDDQHFLDLASQHQALLISKDKAVLKLRKRVAGLGATVGNILLAEQEEALAA